MVEALILLAMFIALVGHVLFGGSKVDPDDNAIWLSASEKARKRHVKLEALYKTEINLVKTLGLNKEDEYVKWYHKHDTLYVNGHTANPETHSKGWLKLQVFLYTAYISKGAVSGTLHRNVVAVKAGISVAILTYLIEEELV